MTACAFRYRLPGERQKWRSGRFDPAVCPDPRAWLEARLGPLAGFEIVQADVADKRDVCPVCPVCPAVA